MKKSQIHPLDMKGREPLDVFLSIPRDAKHLSALFSDGSVGSRWSILAWDPVKVFSFNRQDENGDFLKFMNQRKTNGKSEIPFIGGGIGTIDYEYGYELLRIPQISRRDAPRRVSTGYLGNPFVEFSFYDQAMVYDHHEQKWWGINMPQFVGTGRDLSLQIVALAPSWDFDEYKQRFDFIHENIRLGEIYQACLTFPFLGKPVEDPRMLFYQLAKKHPAPMSAYLEQRQRTIMSLSPERFITWDGVNLETKPIKGTRPRGKTPEKDDCLKKELLSDEKEKAELCMITDLLRNDMARVSLPGTVKVLEHQALQECTNVWHTYSHIRSKTKEGMSAWDILESMFPGGSISGCPKKRAVELLAQVEPSPRGIYTGCIGYISDHGPMDMSIAIRTLEQNETEIRGGFGSGIVYDSVAEAEYQECFDKARHFLSL